MADAPIGPTVPRSAVPAPAEESMVVEFRRRTLLPLDGVLECLRGSIPKLARSSLHRRPACHGISKARVLAFVSACNSAKHLEAICWQTPFKAVCHTWTATPDILRLNPPNLIQGPNT